VSFRQPRRWGNMSNLGKKSLASLALLIFVPLTLSGCDSLPTGMSEPAEVADKLVITGVTIVDPRDGTISPNQTITINGGQITDIGASSANDDSSPPSEKPAKIVDASGKFVVPGYLDMHAHPLNSEDPANNLRLMLANGVTGYRQMSGTPATLEAHRNRTLNGPQDGAKLLTLAGEVLTPLNAGSKEEIGTTIKKQKAEGADFIKVVAVSPETFKAGQKAATKEGLAYVGHLPVGVDAISASNNGMRAMEHYGAGIGLLVDCSSDEMTLKSEISKLPPLEGPPFKVPFLEYFMAGKFERMLVNPVAQADGSDLERTGRAVDSYDPEKCKKVADVFVANETWQVPTLIRLRTMELGNAKEYLNDPNYRYITPEILALWKDVAKDFENNLSKESKNILAKNYALQLKITKLFADNGVKMLAGSDMGGGWLIPGFSLHQEFDELEKAGLSPLKILQMTTINGAEFLNRTNEMGTVEPGKNADLVLLDANPLESVKNMHKIGGVVRSGFYYSKADLEKLKAKIASR